ncbi:MAG TPA: hypothetical protein ENH91_01010 [Leeuwenhoekiella sp.]|nr:hypothetical protein [Leeuwenhoekiella sp.]
MLKNLLLLFLIFQSSLVFAQKTTGKVYNATGVLEDVFVQNITRGETEFTGKTGDFSLNAQVGDSLVFTAPFYVTQKFAVQPYQLSEVWVVELKENLNQLGEVRLSDNRPKEIDMSGTSEGMLKSFHEDYKANPGKYGKGASGNIGWIIGKAISLFKKKNAKEKAGFISYEQLTELFEAENIFDEKLLKEQLKISKENHPLFLEFCTTKNMDAHLIAEDKHFQLLDLLVTYSVEFRDLLEKSTN